MSSEGKKWLGAAPLFDPAEGTTVFAPLDTGQGYWAGAPTAIHDDDTGKFFLCYRVRKPLDKGRGGLSRAERKHTGRVEEKCTAGDL